MARVVDRIPLRVKLVLAVFALTACALGLMSFAAVTALRNHLVSRVDAQLNDMGGQAEAQIRAGRGEVSFAVPGDNAEGVRMPDLYFLESLESTGETIDSVPAEPPADAPDLTGVDLSRSGPVTVDARNGAGRWRVLVVPAPQGRHIVIAERMTEVDGTVGRLAGLITFVGVTVLVAVSVVGVWLVRASLRPLEEIELAATQIATGDLSRRAPAGDPRTEVGRLGEAFNVMISRIEDAFAGQAASEAAARSAESRMRQFVADASHELRTPLTVIRGYAELHGQGAVQDPAALSRLVHRIADESQRMSLLVDDLLLLARLDQRRPLSTGPVDLLALAVDAVQDTRLQAPARTVTLNLTGPGPFVVTGDEARLRQVLTNLLTNAVTHTPPDSTVALRLTCNTNAAVIEVTDTGQGLTAGQAARVFERFYRADTPRTHTGHGPTSTGLGLSIAAAIVTAHKGRIEATATPGAGATFRVELPLHATLHPPTAKAGTAIE
jgi:two-component system OmpR family sensor kinase